MARHKTVPAKEVPALAEKLYGILGRDAAADFARASTKSDWLVLLCEALYANRPVTSLPLQPTHRQLASLAIPQADVAGSASLWTTNFDPLLEIALAQASHAMKLDDNPADWRKYREPNSSSVAPARSVSTRVRHVHGWVDPGPPPHVSPELVLTEAQYMQLFRDPQSGPNQQLNRLLTQEGATLIVGMSLGDANLRRILYSLSREELGQHDIFALLRVRDPLLENFAAEHWRTRNLNLLFVEGYDQIPGLLRDIQYGPPADGDLRPWIEHSAQWVKGELGQSLLFSDQYQRVAHDALNSLRLRLRNLFAVRYEELIYVSFFAPLRFQGEPVKLCKVASTGPWDGSRLGEPRSGSAASQHARERCLALGYLHEQGIAGVAFTSGTTLQVLDAGDGLDKNFTDEMKHAWSNYMGTRDFRSLLAIPVLDTPRHIPVGVLILESNLAAPFWTQFGDQQHQRQGELQRLAVGTARFLLSGEIGNPEVDL